MKGSNVVIIILTVLVVGLGGVGGILCETLVRNGIENIIIVDNDTVDITNKNRQIIALDSTVGMKKTEVLKNRLLDINSNINIKTIDEFITKENINLIFDNDIDYFLQEFCEIRDIDDMKNESQNVWNGCLLYINRKVFKNTNKLKLKDVVSLLKQHLFVFMRI